MSRFIHQCLKPVSAVLTLGGAAGGAYADTSLPHSPLDESQAGPSAPDAAAQQDATPSDVVHGAKVERIHVVGHPFNTMHNSNDMGRMPQDVMHTPQTIDVIPKELIRQQNAKSLDEALKNVPGITASVGEGAGGLSGDQFLIRGFPAQNDIYEDGLRDFGVYGRDSFDYESINVIKGPSSEVFGNGTTGGAINAVTKAPTLANHYNADFSGGSGQYYRGTVDVNQRLGRTAAFRIEGLGASNDVVGRKGVWDKRWGIAPSVAFGLGTKTTIVLQVMHQTDDSVPDYGMPVVAARGSAYGRPISEYGVPRQNWYGKHQDRNHTDDTMETLRLKHKFNKMFTFHNDLRFGEYSRDFEASKVQCGGGCKAALNSGDFARGEITRNTMGSVPLPYRQSSWSFQDVASLQADFNTGFLRHQVVTGFDIEYVHDSRKQDSYAGISIDGLAVAKANMLHPDAGNVTVQRVPAQANSMADIPGIGKKPNSTGYGFDTGIFLYDQIWLTKWASVKGGFRWDRWQSGYKVSGLTDIANNPDKNFPQTTNTFNPTASLVLTPTKWQTVYFTYASSTTPTGMYVTSGAIPVRPGKQGSVDNKPQRAQLYEVGSKFSLLHDRLGATISLFRLEKSNALTSDPVTNSTINTGDRQRNQGLELSLGGMILPGWNITATYALYDPETVASATKANIGKQIQYVPHNQATVWSAYEAFPGKPWNVTVGGGVTWRQGVYLTQDNTAKVPANVEFDSVISHRFGPHWQVSLNGYNLANRLNYNSLFSGYATPAPGRTFLGRLTMDY